MINLDTLRKSKGHVLALVDEKTGKYEPIDADVVEVIRCKDCKYASPNGKYGCTVYHFKRYETHEMKPDGFCSWAVRKEE